MLMKFGSQWKLPSGHVITRIQGITLSLEQIRTALRAIKGCRCSGTQAFRNLVFDRVLEGK